MSELTRNPDFLKITASTTKRVRNLETGVHPTSSELNYYDTYYPRAIDMEGPFAILPAGAGLHTPKWQRRVGVVTLMGAFYGSPNWGAVGATEKFGELPAEARPNAELFLRFPMSNVPYFCFVTVQTDGDLILHKPPGVNEVSSGANAPVWLNSNTWTVN